MEWSKDHKADTAYPDLPHCSAHPSSRNNQSMLVSPTSLSSYPWPLIANGSGDGYIEVQNQQQDQWTYNDYLQIGRQALEYRALSPYPEHLEVRLFVTKSMIERICCYKSHFRGNCFNRPSSYYSLPAPFIVLSGCIHCFVR